MFILSMQTLSFLSSFLIELVAISKLQILLSTLKQIQSILGQKMLLIIVFW